METAQDEKPEILLVLSNLFIIKHFAALLWSRILFGLDYSKYKTLNNREYLCAHKHSSCSILYIKKSLKSISLLST